jgi:integrase
MVKKTSDPLSEFTWQCLEGTIAPEVLRAPKTGGDPHGVWPSVHGRIVRYLLRSVAGTPWADHVVLIAAVLSARRRDVSTVEGAVRTFNTRFRLLFQALDLKTVDEWNADRHLPPYLKGEIIVEDSRHTRYNFLTAYMSATKQLGHWLDALPEASQQIYRRFVLSAVNPHLTEGLITKQEVVQPQQQHRKAETEAVVPHFAALRAEAHFRFNRLTRLRQAYQQALKEVLPDHSNLPFVFSYEEGDPSLERYHFRLWDRRSFVKARATQYGPTTRASANKGVRQYTEDRNQVFLEFVSSEQLGGEISVEGFWFTELLKLNLIAINPQAGNEDEVKTRQAWLRDWGYGSERSSTITTPFAAFTPGLLTWADEERGASKFMAEAQRRTEGTLIPVEPLYAAAAFGLLALDILSSTGMRVNELMQINVSRECIVRLVDDPPPGARDQAPRIRYLFRLIPKGERTDTLHNYGIGKETVRLVERVCQLLCTHYKLQPGEPLPHVPFDPHHGRSHRFEAAPYLFQYAHHHLNDQAIAACLRFLLHGMVFQTSQGTPVVIKPHLLRHAFATFAVQVEGLPIDLVAKWLQQKNLEVTGYYSEMPEYMQLEQHSSFVARLATQINVREAILRSPEEIQKQAEAARKRVGMLVPVCGGDCTIDVYCPNQFDCIHCPAKSPDPEKRYQVEEKRRWAEERLAYYEREGLVLEAEKMRHLIRACDLELREMEQIVTYRKDENRVIQIQPRLKRPS